MHEKIKNWYRTAFPTDELGESLDEKATFGGLLIVLVNHVDVYEYIGVGDSIVRERLFAQLSIIIGCEYDFVYRLWISRK